MPRNRGMPLGARTTPHERCSTTKGGGLNFEDGSKSEASAWAILRRYVAAVRAAPDCCVEALLLAGSLATGSYVPGPSDVDQITVIHQDAPQGTEDRLLTWIERAMEAYGNEVHLAPVVYRRSNLDRPWLESWDLRRSTRHLITVPEELLRIHDHGRVLHGAPSFVNQLPRPTRGEVLAYHLRWRCWDHEIMRNHPHLDPAIMTDIPIRLAVQVILSRAVWHHYFATGSTCLNKNVIARRLAAEVPGYRFQEGVDLAAQVRRARFSDGSQQVRERLTAWCRRFLDWKSNRRPDEVPRN